MNQPERASSPTPASTVANISKPPMISLGQRVQSSRNQGRNSRMAGPVHRKSAVIDGNAAVGRLENFLMVACDDNGSAPVFQRVNGIQQEALAATVETGGWLVHQYQGVTGQKESRSEEHTSE